MYLIVTMLKEAGHWNIYSISLEAKLINSHRDHIQWFLKARQVLGWGTDCTGAQNSAEVEVL